MSATGMSISTAAWVPPLCPTSPGGISELSPFPSPLRRTIVHLLGDVAVGDGATRLGVERDDRLAERRGFGQPHGARYHCPHDLVAEVVAHLLHHLIRQLGAGVVHHAHDR